VETKTTFQNTDQFLQSMSLKKMSEFLEGRGGKWKE
jgi:hypothetical protein